ncbi:MAG: hypothetical protein FWF97_01645 [Alphaproteobacteria bacterium]|nr:hypothetical protein [Alphaproteobacteria bacterium]
MQNKLMLLAVLAAISPIGVRAAEDVEDYNPEGSLFQMIADLEQEKILMQLEKERAQLQLDMDRLAAEQVRIRNEMDAMSGASQAQTGAIELERQRLELEREKLEQQKMSMESRQPERAPATSKPAPSPINERYRLIEIVGAGRQLFATVEDVTNGQRRKVSVGKNLDDYRVESVSIDEGVVLSKGGEITVLGVYAGE